MSLSTHVLDVAIGQPAVGIRVSLFRGDEDLNSDSTNNDGRCGNLSGAAPLLEGIYRLVFEVGPYLARTHPQPGGPFFEIVTVEFTVSGPARHYHIPLLLSPFGYTVYRGS